MRDERGRSAVNGGERGGSRGVWHRLGVARSANRVGPYTRSSRQNEADSLEDHRRSRDVFAAMEKALADAMAAAGYHVVNELRAGRSLTTNCLRPFAATSPNSFRSWADCTGEPAYTCPCRSQEPRVARSVLTLPRIPTSSSSRRGTDNRQPTTKCGRVLRRARTGLPGIPRHACGVTSGCGCGAGGAVRATRSAALRARSAALCASTSGVGLRPRPSARRMSATCALR